MHKHNTHVINIPQQAQLALGTCFGLLFFTSLPTWATCSKTLPEPCSSSIVSARSCFGSFSKCNSFVFKASFSRLIKEIRNWHNGVSSWTNCRLGKKIKFSHWRYLLNSFVLGLHHKPLHTYFCLCRVKFLTAHNTTFHISPQFKHQNILTTLFHTGESAILHSANKVRLLRGR